MFAFNATGTDLLLFCFRVTEERSRSRLLYLTMTGDVLLEYWDLFRSRSVFINEMEARSWAKGLGEIYYFQRDWTQGSQHIRQMKRNYEALRYRVCCVLKQGSFAVWPPEGHHRGVALLCDEADSVRNAISVCPCIVRHLSDDRRSAERRYNWPGRDCITLILFSAPLFFLTPSRFPPPPNFAGNRL